MEIQTQLKMPISARTTVVPVVTARACLGVDVESVWGMIDDGRLRWVWDLSLGRYHREWRIWARELIAPELCVGLERDYVIKTVIGTERERLRSVEVGQLMVCSRNHMVELIRAGELTGPRVGHTQWIERSSLERFLQVRMVG